jgi:HEAT repeat protein
LEDEDWRVAHNAAVALGDTATEPDVVVPALVKGLNCPEQIRSEALPDGLSRQRRGCNQPSIPN